MRKFLFAVVVFYIILSCCQVFAQVRCLATRNVNSWDIETANEVSKWFIENRQEIADDFFRYEFYSDSVDLTLVFVRYEIEGETILQEVILRKEIREGRKCYDVLFCGERTMFLEYSEGYGYGYDEVVKLYFVQDIY